VQQEQRALFRARSSSILRAPFRRIRWAAAALVV